MPVSSVELCDKGFLEPILTELINEVQDLHSLTPKVIYSKLSSHLKIDQEIITSTPETKQFVKSMASTIAKRINDQRELLKPPTSRISEDIIKSPHSKSPHSKSPKSKSPHGKSPKKHRKSSPTSQNDEEDEEEQEEKAFKRVRKITNDGTNKIKRIESKKEHLRNIVKKMKAGPALYRNMPKGDDVAYVVELENRIRAKCQELKIPCAPNSLPEISQIVKRIRTLEMEEELNSIGLKDWEKTSLTTDENASQRRRRRRGPLEDVGHRQKKRRTDDDSSRPENSSLVNGDETLKSSDIVTSESDESVGSAVDDSDDINDDSEEEDDEEDSDEESEFEASDLTSEEEEEVASSD